MSTKYWLGDATAVAKVITLTIANESPGETFSISSGGVEIASWEHTTGEGLDDVVFELVSLWNNSAHPYATSVTASVGVSGSGEVILTADVAGWEFDVTPAVDVSSAATFTKSVTTALAGPNVWSTGNNWWDVAAGTRGTAPVTGDDIILRDSNVSICWGMDQSAVTLASLTVDESFTGNLGVKFCHFTVDATGQTVSTTAAREYRQHHLKIGATRVDIGKRTGTGASTGSGRIKIHNTAATETTVHRTGTQCTDTCMAAVRLRFDNASSNLYIASAQKGVAIAMDEPGETSSLTGVHFDTVNAADWVKIGEGVTLNHVNMANGKTLLQSATFVTTANVSGGALTTEGDFVLGTLNAYGGRSVLNHVNSSSGNETDTINLKGGEVDLTEGQEPKVIGTLNPETGVLRIDNHSHTVSVWNEPAGRRTVMFT